MSRIKVTVSKSNLSATVRELSKAVQTAIRNEGLNIYDRSQNLVPVMTGALKAGGTVTDIKDGVEIEYKAFRGSFNYAYAVEDPDNHFNYHHPFHKKGRSTYNCGGESHYLENAFVDENLTEAVEQATVKAVEKNFYGGGDV